MCGCVGMCVCVCVCVCVGWVMMKGADAEAHVRERVGQRDRTVVGIQFQRVVAVENAGVGFLEREKTEE